MKKNLGSLLFFFLLNTLHASPLCDYYFDVSTETPFVKEGVEITFITAQKDKSAVMFYALTPKKNANFELHFIKKEEVQGGYHDKTVRYSYLLYPLKAGEFSLSFDFKVSQASDKSMEVFASGNRDVIKPMMTDETDIALKPLHFKVKETPHDVSLYGDYTLQMHASKQEISPFDTFNVTYTITGKGYPSSLKTILPKSEGVEQFLEVEKMKNGTQVFHYAFSANKDFNIPAPTLLAFSPEKNKKYMLTTETLSVKVNQPAVKEILDSKNSLPNTALNWENFISYINSVLLFLAGYLIAKLNPLQYLVKKQPSQNPLHQKIKDCKDEKSLLKLLLSENSQDFKGAISTLEACIYHGEKASFKKIKDALLSH